MADKAKNAPAEETTTTETATVEAVVTPEAKAPETKETTVGEALNIQPKSDKAEAKVVPEAVFLEYKKDNKQLQKDIKELKSLIETGGSKKEVSDDVKALAEKYDIDADFIQELASTVQAKAEEAAEAKFKPLADKDRAKEFDEAFTTHYDKTLEALPEFKDVANREVIKALVKDPANKDKTFAQILESAYGHLITGKRTIETTTPGGGKEDAEIDFDRARKDTEYFKEVMSNPHTKKKYNEALEKRLKL